MIVHAATNFDVVGRKGGHPSTPGRRTCVSIKKNYKTDTNINLYRSQQWRRRLQTFKFFRKLRVRIFVQAVYTCGTTHARGGRLYSHLRSTQEHSLNVMVAMRTSVYVYRKLFYNEIQSMPQTVCLCQRRCSSLLFVFALLKLQTRSGLTRNGSQIQDRGGLISSTILKKTEQPVIKGLWTVQAGALKRKSSTILNDHRIIEKMFTRNN